MVGFLLSLKATKKESLTKRGAFCAGIGRIKKVPAIIGEMNLG